MAIGKSKRQVRFEDPVGLLGERLKGVYRLLAEHGEALFAVDYFADLYKRSTKGRPAIPARVVATVMILQALEGLSDREAVDRLGCDLRWQAAAGVHIGYVSFDPTTLVGMRNRLRASARPKRLLEDVVGVAREATVMGRRVRVVDSTPVFDAVATQDTGRGGVAVAGWVRSGHLGVVAHVGQRLGDLVQLGGAAPIAPRVLG